MFITTMPRIVDTGALLALLFPIILITSALNLYHQKEDQQMSFCIMCDYIWRRFEWSAKNNPTLALPWLETPRCVWKYVDKFDFHIECNLYHHKGYTSKSTYLMEADQGTRLYERSMQILINTEDSSHRLLSKEPEMLHDTPTVLPMALCLPYIRSWLLDRLSQCAQNHFRVEDWSPSEQFLPKRLLYLGSNDVPEISLYTTTRYPYQRLCYSKSLLGGRLAL